MVSYFLDPVCFCDYMVLYDFILARRHEQFLIDKRDINSIYKHTIWSMSANLEASCQNRDCASMEN